jgi:hypothetical protein
MLFIFNEIVVGTPLQLKKKTLRGLGDPLIESLGRIRGQFSGLSRVIRTLVAG